MTTLKQYLADNDVTYGAMSDADVSAALKAVDQSRDRAVMTGDETFAATNATQFNNLSANDKQLWMAFCARQDINPFGAANVALVQEIFSGGATLTALQALRVEQVSIAELEGFAADPEDIAEARS